MASWRLVASLAGDGHAQDGFEDAVTMARQSGDRRILAAVRAEQAHAWSGTVLGRPAGPGGMLATTAELDRLAAGLGDDEMAYQASLAYGEALLTAGDVAGVDRLIQRDERLAREHGVAYRGWVPLVQRSARAVMGGDFVQGERIAERALAVGLGPLGEAAVVTHAAQMVLLRWLQGRPSEVEAALDAAVERSSPQLGWSRLHLLAQVGHGRQAQVRRDLDAAVASGFAGRSSATDVVALVGACALLGDEDAASRLYELLRSWSGWHIVAGHHYLGAADHHLGILAATAGRWRDAERHLSRALVSHRRLRARPWFALTADAFAGMLRCRGEPHDQHRAGQFEGTALALAAAHGMTLPAWASAGLGPRARPVRSSSAGERSGFIPFGG
jgi:hypothetical protein